MKSVSFVVNNYFLKNRIFDISNPAINRDNCLMPLYYLKNSLREKNIDLSTYDINTIETSDIVLYHDVDKVLPKKNQYDKSYLLLFESEPLKPKNWNKKNHKLFKKIFTWNDDLVDNKKYFKFNFPIYKSNDSINKNLSIKEKLCVMIAGYKLLNHPNELYSKRIEAIRWFEKNHPNDFDLYGIGWDEFTSSNRYIRGIFKKLKLTKIFKPHFSNYKGKVVIKKNILEKYKFAICYENAKDIPGYITEKIFDCFFAGCVPIYCGANNITDHIPYNCFIDKRDFKTYEDLYKFMTEMDDKTYLSYIDNIEKFINGEKFYQFSSEYFVRTIIENITSASK